MVLEPLLDLFFPRRCVGCGVEGSWLCPTCARSLEVEGRGEPPNFLNFKQSLVRELLHNFKYNGLADIALNLHQVVASTYSPETFKELLGVGEGLLVPVPTTPLRQRQRGYNQAEALARVFGSWLGWPVWSGGLQRRRGSQTLVGRGVEDRAAEAERAFGWSGMQPPLDLPLVLIDDLWTTGSTWLVCQKILELHTGKIVKGFVLARA